MSDDHSAGSVSNAGGVIKSTQCSAPGAAASASPRITTEWSEPATAEDCAAGAGVDLQGEEGHPFHCGERMQTKGGIVGVDYARCKCGLLMVRADSPHTNGGHIFSEEFYQQHPAGLWTWRMTDA